MTLDYADFLARRKSTARRALGIRYQTVAAWIWEATT